MDICDTKIELMKYMYVSDLYFAVSVLQDCLMEECHTCDIKWISVIQRLTV